MIDMTDTKSPTYYYYVCNERIEDELNLDDFYIKKTFNLYRCIVAIHSFKLTG